MVVRGGRDKERRATAAAAEVDDDMDQELDSPIESPVVVAPAAPAPVPAPAPARVERPMVVVPIARAMPPPPLAATRSMPAAAAVTADRPMDDRVARAVERLAERVQRSNERLREDYDDYEPERDEQPERVVEHAPRTPASADPISSITDYFDRALESADIDTIYDVPSDRASEGPSDRGSVRGPHSAAAARKSGPLAAAAAASAAKKPNNKPNGPLAKDPAGKVATQIVVPSKAPMSQQQQQSVAAGKSAVVVALKSKSVSVAPIELVKQVSLGAATPSNAAKQQSTAAKFKALNDPFYMDDLAGKLDGMSFFFLLCCVIHG
ncbi:hypothetical protein BC828DRAFT_392274 [Blastocladiella britannica]|nr:hypothetical protein BC828DRAFT_392274 [Blastocladiella britannica]